MQQLTEQDIKWRDTLNIRNCRLSFHYDLHGKSRFHPITKERIEENASSPTPFVRIAYAEAWRLTLEDIKDYNIMMVSNYCATRGCCNPLHWRAYPKAGRNVTRVPFWIEEAVNGERKWLRDHC